MFQKPLRVELMKITPDLAREWLTNNNLDTNRDISKVTVLRIAQAITRGEWKFNGDTIKFDRKNRLVDGQHRLEAIVKADTTVESLVAFGVDDEAYITIDVNRPKTLAVFLKHAGEANAKNLASVVRAMYHFESSQYRTWYPAVKTPTIAQGFEVLDRHPALRDQVYIGYRMATIGGTGAYWSVLDYVFSRIDEELATYYREGILKGVALAENDPVLLLRNALMKEKTRKHSEMSKVTMIALKIKAWNTLYAGEGLQMLRWRVVGPTAESFPTIAGIDDYWTTIKE